MPVDEGTKGLVKGILEPILQSNSHKDLTERQQRSTLVKEKQLPDDCC
jgi:hypothetical protein